MKGNKMSAAVKRDIDKMMSKPMPMKPVKPMKPVMDKPRKGR